MEQNEQRLAALQMITLDLQRLLRCADAHKLALLAYLIEMALAEARSELGQTDV
jgi:hypothetical protein